MLNIEIQNRWMSPKVFELNYQIKESTQAKMRMKKMLPYSKIGGFIRYDKIEIDKLFEEHKIVEILN